MKQHPQETAPDTGSEILMSKLLAGCSTEIAASARSCTQLQWVMSRLLETAQHPDLAAEMHVLQDIDRLQQTLGDLACLLELISSRALEQPVQKEDFLSSLRLVSLRTRLLNEPAGSDSQQEGLESCEASDVTWL